MASFPKKSSFWIPWAQVLMGLDRMQRAKTSLDVLFGGLSRFQRVKRPRLIGCSLFLFLCEQSTQSAIC
jgi:hypothetical protein